MTTKHSEELDEIFDRYLPNRTATKQAILSKYIEKSKVLEALNKKDWHRYCANNQCTCGATARNGLRAELKKSLGLGE